MLDDLQIELVGGPYDGYQHRVDIDRDELVSRAQIPVNRDMLRGARGLEVRELTINYSADYRLRLSTDGLRYEFAGFCPTDARVARKTRQWQRTLARRRQRSLPASDN